MTFGSICSGIEAASAAWHPLGWTPKFFAEIAPFPSAVLMHHYPDIPNHGDFTKLDRSAGPVDVLVGGTPCQSFSVAGKRAGLDDPRGNLTLEFLALAGRIKPRWLVWENVPGVLSDDGGRTFGAVLGILGKLGYGFAYRILDAQHWGVPQRRRRVFVVGCLGSWQCAAAVLFERESLRGYPTPSREAGKGFTHDLAPSLTGSGRGVERSGESRGQDPVVAMCLNGKGGSGRIDGESETFVTHSLRAEGFDASEDGTGRGVSLVPIAFRGMAQAGNGWAPQSCPSAENVALTLDATRSQAIAFSCKDHGADVGETVPTPRSMNSNGAPNGGGQVAVAFQSNAGGQGGDVYEDLSPTLRSQVGGGGGMPAVAFGISNQPTPKFGSDVMPTLNGHCTGGRGDAVAFNLRGREGGAQAEMSAVASVRSASGGSSRSYVSQSAVRRLTVEECESLQGFSRGYTKVPYRGKPAADGPRYAAIGNSMAVPVMRWIGERIQAVHEATA